MAAPLVGSVMSPASGLRRPGLPPSNSHAQMSSETISPTLASHAAMFSPGDLIWVPSASEGYSTAVFISLNIAQETLTAQLHPVASEHAAAARAALQDLPSAAPCPSSSLGTPPSLSQETHPPGIKRDTPEEEEEEEATLQEESHAHDGLFLKPTTTNGTTGSAGDIAAALLAELGETGNVPLSPLSAAVQAHQEALSVPCSPRDSRPRICVFPPAGIRRDSDGSPNPQPAVASGSSRRTSGLDAGAFKVWARESSVGDGSGAGASAARSECTVTVPLADCWPYHPSPLPPAQPPEDASALDSLSSPSILELLEHRFIRRQIYTNAAHVLLALNPYTDLKELYSQDVIEVYRHWKNNSAASAAAVLPPSTARLLGLVKSCLDTSNFSGDSAADFHGSPFPPPHPFAVAEDAHRRLRGEGRNQTIIVSGESGAGKTETSKIIMLYLTQVGVLSEAERTPGGAFSGTGVSLGGSRQERERAVAAMLGEGGKGQTKTQVTSLQQKILSCNPVLEAFCNATTKRNVNSSRVGRLTLLHFDTVGLLRGASIKTYLLESARVSAHSPWERNYHIFYQILRGCTEEDLARRGLTRDCGAYGLLRPTQPQYPQQQRCGRMQSRNTAEDTRMRSTAKPGSGASALRPPSQEEVERDERNFRALLDALRTTGFSGRQISELLDILAGLLHLSNVTFKEAPPLKAGDTHCLLVADSQGEENTAESLGPSSFSRNKESRASSAPGDERKTSGTSPQWAEDDTSPGKDEGEEKRQAGPEDEIAADDLKTNSSKAAQALRNASELLQIPEDELLDALRWEILRTKHDVVKKERREKQAFAARDALIKYIYKKMVAHVLGELNRNVKRCTGTSVQGDDVDGESRIEDDGTDEIGDATPDYAGNFIGILDIYGFECVDGFNGFDQLCINYANERQQELFIQKVLHEELRLYCREGIMAAPSVRPNACPLSAAPPPPRHPRHSSAGTFSSSSAPFVHAPAHSRNVSQHSPKHTPDGAAPSSCLVPFSSEGLPQSRQQSSFLLTPSHFSSPVPYPVPLPGRTQHSPPSIPDSSLLLFYLHEGLFRRLDDNSRLKAQGQARTDANFWKDFFLFCRQQDQYGGVQQPSGEKRESSTLERDALDQSLMSPILFKAKGGVTAALNIQGGGGGGAAGGASAGLACVSWKKRQELQEAEEGLVSAGKVSPQLADGNAAANKLAEGVFVIRHFAGLVEYSVEGWLDRNNDKAEASIETLLTTASSMRTLNRLGRLEVSPDSQQNADPAPPSPLLTAAGMHGAAKERLASLVYGRTGGGGGNFLAGTGGSGSGSNSRGGGGHFVSLSRNFINDLKQLMCQLQSAEMHLHFIRCFVPNAQMLPLTFNRLLLLKQLQQSGSVALVHILHQGFPHRLPLRATAASFKARLAVCLNTVLEQTAGAGGDPEVRRKLKTLQNLHNLPDGRLISSALSLLPTCPPGTHCCGTSLICLKAQAFPAASQLLRHPETFFSTSRPFVDLATELTRRRWRIAGLVIGGRIHRVLLWLLRRVQLLRRLKEEGARLAVRIILLKRVILRPLRRRIETRAKIKQGLNALGKFSLSRGFRTWKKNWRRWADAEAAIASLEARRRLKESGAKSGVVPNWKRKKSKEEDGETLDGGELGRALSWRQLAMAELKKKQEEEEERRKRHTEEEEEEERQRQQRVVMATFQALQNAKEGWRTAWKAELFALGMRGEEAREEIRRQDTSSGKRKPTGDGISSEKMLLFSGGNLYNVSLFFKRRKKSQSRHSPPPSPSSRAERHTQRSASLYNRRFDRSGFSSGEEDEGGGAGHRLAALRTGKAGDGPGLAVSPHPLELVDVKTSLCCFRELFLSSLSESSSSPGACPFTSSLLNEFSPNTKRGSFDNVSKATVRPPCLSCLGQHQQHPNLFVACDVSARIFLMPFSLRCADPATPKARSTFPTCHSSWRVGEVERGPTGQSQGGFDQCKTEAADNSANHQSASRRATRGGTKTGSCRRRAEDSGGGSTSPLSLPSSRCSPCAPPPRRVLKEEGRESSFEHSPGRGEEKNTAPSLVLLMKAASPPCGDDFTRRECSVSRSRQSPNRPRHTPSSSQRDVRRDTDSPQDIPPSPRAMRRKERRNLDASAFSLQNPSAHSDRPSYSCTSSFEDPGLRQENAPPPTPALSRIGSQCSSLGETVSSSSSSTSASCSFRRSSSLGGSSTSSHSLHTDPSRGQPSTWLPSLVPTSRWYYGGAVAEREASVLCNSDAKSSLQAGALSRRGTDEVSGNKEFLQIRSSNPYICRFFREMPPPLPRHFFYPPSYSPLALSLSTRAPPGREEDDALPFDDPSSPACLGEKSELHTGPKLFVSSSFPSSTLLLPGWACLPASIAPVAWTPDALLRRAQREREKWQKRNTPREKRETGVSPKRPHEAAVRTLRVRFASPHSTVYVLILCHIAVSPEEGKKHNRVGGGGACVGGILGLVLLNLTTQKPEAWVEIIPAEPDVVTCARKHKEVLQELLYTPGACSNRGSIEEEEILGGMMVGGGEGNPADCGREEEKSSKAVPSLPLRGSVSHHSRSKIISATLLEPLGEGGDLWVVAGAAVLAVVKVTLPHLCPVHGGSESRKRGGGARKTWDREEDFLEPEERERSASLEVVWNAATVQSISPSSLPLDIASTWFTGCMYTASPLSSLQDVCSSHPLFYFSSVFSSSVDEDSSEFLTSLRKDVQRLLLLSTARGELALLRWLQNKRMLQLLETKVGPKKHSTRETRFGSSPIQRFLRVEYTSQKDDENGYQEEATDQASPSYRADVENTKLRSLKSRATTGGAVLKVTATHPHLEKRKNDFSPAYNGGEPYGRSFGKDGGKQRELVETRWCEDIASVRMRSRTILRPAPLVRLPGASSSPRKATKLEKGVAKRDRRGTEDEENPHHRETGKDIFEKKDCKHPDERMVGNSRGAFRHVETQLDTSTEDDFSSTEEDLSDEEQENTARPHRLIAFAPLSGVKDTIAVVRVTDTSQPQVSLLDVRQKRPTSWSQLEL